MTKCLVMFSGGLDSVIAAHLLKEQGCDVAALHFVLPFESGVGKEHATIRSLADSIAIPLILVEEAEEFLPMIKNPRFGYGKHANPCLDCRIHRIRKAKEIMDREGSRFIATGEVVGQRPMSQRMECLNAIAKRSGLEGLLLRPLSAKLLAATIPEQKGWVDREKLLGIHGRGRKEQLAYAKKHGLAHLPPAGGCMLTQAATARRFTDLRDATPHFSLADFKLLAYGRHFRMSPQVKLVVGRNEKENEILTMLAQKEDCFITPDNIPGASALLKGPLSSDQIQTAAAITARFSKAKDKKTAHLIITQNGATRTIEVTPANEELYDKMRI
ncbi:MAG: DUF814 domain-containing protein [Chitinivibrionales bacterium]|nr:DUF814 domain-containing protein [Chitinivibrionales bacterium]